MGALTIAFDTTIVGALALPWVVLMVHLFFFRGERGIVVLLRWVRRQNQPAVAGVLLFAITYSLGSAISRIAQDFFNDDDLHVQFPTDPPLLLRVGVNEERILTSVYCQNTDLLYVAGGSHAGTESQVAGNSADDGADPLTHEIRAFKRGTSPQDFLCKQTLSWVVRYKFDAADNWLYKTATSIFGLQENALMEKGADYTVRLRQLHDQVMVLRGAGFNGVVGFSLCLFAWGAQVRRENPRSKLLWVLAALPGIYLALTVLALMHHFFERGIVEPPYMEYTLLLLGLGGGWVVWKRPGQAAETDSRKKTGAKYSWPKEAWRRSVVVSGILTAAAIFGWWSTEVFYAEQVIYSYNSQGPSGAQK
jgi:hypothetical protein